MQIRDDWRYDDHITALRFRIIDHPSRSVLRVINSRGEARDLYFRKDGRFDGCASVHEVEPPWSTTDAAKDAANLDALLKRYQPKRQRKDKD